MISRRELMLGGAAAIATGGLLARLNPVQADTPATAPAIDAQPPQTSPAGGHHPVVTPNGSTLPWRLVDGVKIFRLIAEPVHHEFSPGLDAECWGYNGSVHGPTIEAVEGDRVRIYVTNKLAAPTSIHWHGILLPNGMDGVGGLNQRAIRPGETFKYEFTLRQHGTFMYHSHHDEMIQIAMGMTGLFIIHPRPRKLEEEAAGRDYAIMLSEWKIPVGSRRPDPAEMTDFNILTMNGRCFPGTAPLLAATGDRVRIRLGNLGPMSHHPIHLHGHVFTLVATEGGDIPLGAQWPMSTVLVPVGATRTIEFTADAPGDWAFHCHMTHHGMNQMGHGAPNLLGIDPAGFDEKVRKLLPGYMTMGHQGMADMSDMGMAVPPNTIPMGGGKGPFDDITMGGMFTLLKVRDNLQSDSDPGWYEHPRGEVADAASPEELRRDLSAPIPAATAPATTQPVIYACPMHPEVTSDKPGRCPRCGMNLTLKK